MITPEDGLYKFRDSEGEWQELPVEIMELLVSKYGLHAVLHDRNAEPQVEFV